MFAVHSVLFVVSSLKTLDMNTRRYTPSKVRKLESTMGPPWTESSDISVGVVVGYSYF